MNFKLGHYRAAGQEGGDQAGAGKGGGVILRSRTTVRNCEPDFDLGVDYEKTSDGDVLVGKFRRNFSPIKT